MGFTPYQRMLVPRTPVARANRKAARLLRRPRTKGLFLVRLILASKAGSKSMLSVFADAMVRNVPLVRKPRVRVLREGAAVTDVLSRPGIGYMEYDAVVVNTIRKASRGLQRARKVLTVRLSDLEGASDAARERVEEASGGSCCSASSASASSFNRFRRRCGGSCVVAGAAASECGSAGVCVAENAAVDCALLLSGVYDLVQKTAPALCKSCLLFTTLAQKYDRSSGWLRPAVVCFELEVAVKYRGLQAGFCSSLPAQPVQTSSSRMACARARYGGRNIYGGGIAEPAMMLMRVEDYMSTMSKLDRRLQGEVADDGQCLLVRALSLASPCELN